MSCSPFDLRDYVLGELGAADQAETKHHVTACQECREELDRLRLTRAALMSLRDEELPRRIGFVSDKVFEPSPLRRGWHAFWGSAARLGFASAAMLTVALLFSALHQPAPVMMPPPVDQARIEAEISRRVEQAVAESEERQAKLITAAERRVELDRKADRIALEESIAVLAKRRNVMYLASSDLGGPK